LKQSLLEEEAKVVGELVPSDNKIDITASVAEEDKYLVRPAGMGGAILGFLMGGPILSLLLGFGSAYAVRRQDTAGDAARKESTKAPKTEEKDADASGWDSEPEQDLKKEATKDAAPVPKAGVADNAEACDWDSDGEDGSAGKKKGGPSELCGLWLQMASLCGELLTEKTVRIGLWQMVRWSPYWNNG